MRPSRPFLETFSIKKLRNCLKNPNYFESESAISSYLVVVAVGVDGGGDGGGHRGRRRLRPLHLLLLLLLLELLLRGGRSLLD